MRVWRIRKIFTAILLMTVVTVSAQNKTAKNNAERLKLADEIDHSIRTELLNKWYPQSVDSLYGGFLTTFTYNFLPTGPQIK
jgi:mannobiose 2-epimerase